MSERNLRTRAAILVLAGCALAAPAHAADPPGKAMYMSACSACHRPDGVGVKGAFPALAGGAFAVGPKTQVVGRVLNGRGGMPSFKADLTDDQIAAILTYVRSSWGNKAEAVKPADVAAVRTGGAPVQTRSLQAH